MTSWMGWGEEGMGASLGVGRWGWGGKREQRRKLRTLRLDSGGTGSCQRPLSVPLELGTEPWEEAGPLGSVSAVGPRLPRVLPAPSDSRACLGVGSGQLLSGWARYLLC